MAEEKMMRKLSLALAFLFIASVSLAEESEDDILFHKPTPYKTNGVTTTAVTIPSQKADINPEEDCAPFAITPKRATFFFKHTRSVSRYTRDYYSIHTSCSAEGIVKFANGDEGHWIISRGGTGSLLLLNGKFKDKLVLLYCEKCAKQDW